ncbi:unnamed protein product [Cyprideis torosa]|uniref:Uncharacterized protein n=1 Tax=Cyprideis torosa TaxID=163714 RepID=A0A7R8WQK2_9CRUS|nr:unnamed protein product [Cyprideis torosa]CAG0907820.1 unnamed protein product [Cyprideis torosa]
MRQLKGKVKETPKQKKERKQSPWMIDETDPTSPPPPQAFSPEAKEGSVRLAVPVFVSFWVLLALFIYFSTRAKNPAGP